MLGDEIGLEVDLRADGTLAERGHRQRMRHQRDAELVSIDRIDGQTHAVDRDRALHHQVPRQVRRGEDVQVACLAAHADRDDPTDAVHVSGDQMAAQRVAHGKRAFEVNAITDPPPAESGQRQRLGAEIRGEATRRPVHDRQADPIDGDARAERQAFHRQAGRDDQAARNRPVAQLDDSSNRFDDSRKHARRTVYQAGEFERIGRGPGWRSPSPPGMVRGMATTKVTITLDDDQLRAIRELVSSGKADNVSQFVKHAVAVSLADVAGWGAMLGVALEQTGGPLTRKERVWADSILRVRRGNKRDRRAA